MAFELIGIENENDFYPAAFLSSALEAEIADAISRWATDGSSVAPDKRLEPIAEEFLRELRRIRQAGSRDLALESAKTAVSSLVRALGYDYQRGFASLDGGGAVPILARVADADGRDRLWVIEASLPGKDDEAADPLSMSFSKDQFPESLSGSADPEVTIQDVISAGIFDQPEPPRFVLVVSPAQLVLVDRNKWASRSVLRFDLAEIFTRGDRATLQAMACFVSREARVPQTGIPLAERLEEEAQRHANAVTGSLKKTVREAIELLGNEVLAACENKYPKGHPRAGVWIESQDLSIECLRYMYRLLFLFYAEANPRLGIVRMDDPAYRTGYSLEALRALESVRLRTVEDKEGTYIWQSLQRLLGMMFVGLSPSQIGAQRTFSLPRVRVSLLDPKSTPILSRVQLRNEALQKIIRLLSLKQDKAGTGRISYAQLGIGQLGAVYETLISFTGFVAKTDLIELIPGKGAAGDTDDEDAGDEEDDSDETAEDGEEAEAYSATNKIDPLAPSYFVERSRADEFKPEQIVYDGPQARIYKKGSFIYRLAGRDRQKSASYYTPEPLARLLVKHALMERCKDLGADEILELKILEPAMGSAAFLVEATNQLADLYLERKQTETGQRIPQEDYFEERQRVRAYIADRNCFGVDLNPIAVELGQISLWLNSLHNGEFSPWFGDQLHAGNSLIGARRASYPKSLLSTKSAKDLWLNQKPEEIGWRGTRPANHVWQFLLPAKDMAKFDTEKSIAEFAKPAQDAIKAWRRNGFFAPFEDHEVKILIQLSEAADVLFESVADDLKKMRSSCNDEITLWPGKTMPGVKGQDYNTKLERLRVLQGAEHVSNSLPYQRLKTAMDAWCALWLWPLDQTDKLPSRQQFLFGLTSILKGGITSSGEIDVSTQEDMGPKQGDLLTRQEAADALAAELPSANKQSALFQPTDIDALVEASPWLKVAQQVAARERFTHYDLIFSDVLRERGGFDLIVGNPPWAKPKWAESEVLADMDPKLAVKKLSAPEVKRARAETLSERNGIKQYLDQYVSMKGTIVTTSSREMFPFAGSGQNNLYRCFVDLSFRLLGRSGVSALIHQDGHLMDPKAGSFRRAWYERILKNFEFSNKLSTKNFAEVGDQRWFSLNVYRGTPNEVGFDRFSNAFLAAQIDEAYMHDGSGPVPGIRDETGKWETRGHAARIVRITIAELATISSLVDPAVNDPLEARFVAPFSSSFLNTFHIFSKTHTLKQAQRSWQIKRLWEQGKAELAGTLLRRKSFEHPEYSVLQGPHFYVGNLYSKCAKTSGWGNSDYEVIDLENLPEDFTHRTNFCLRGDAHHTAEAPTLQWDTTRLHTDAYRLAVRKRISTNSERSLISCLMPPGVNHVHQVQSIAFQDDWDLLKANALMMSVPVDFLLKASARADFMEDDAGSIPWPELPLTAMELGTRLCCLTSQFSNLWLRHSNQLGSFNWHFDDPRLNVTGERKISSSWNRNIAIRNDFSRRMALVEIDVLVAQSLGLELEQLIEIYKVYFGLLQLNEAGTWYDRNGRIVWTVSKALPGVGYLNKDCKPISKAEWELLCADFDRRPPEEQALTCKAIDDTHPGGPREVTRRFLGPFTKCDRIEDYKRAWAFFEAHKDGKAAQ